MSRLKIGDKVICITAIKEQPDSWTTGLVAGEEYTIRDIHNCSIRSCATVAVGVPMPDNVFVGSIFCASCRERLYERFHYDWRFIKIDPDLALRDQFEERMIRRIEPAKDSPLSHTLIHQGNTPK